MLENNSNNNNNNNNKNIKNKKISIKYQRLNMDVKKFNNSHQWQYSGHSGGIGFY